MAINVYKVFLVEDHPVLRRELRQLLDRETDLEVIGEAVSAEDALAQLPSLKPHLLTVDFSLPGMSGVELVRQLRQERPELGCLVITGHIDDIYRHAALAAGAKAFIDKAEPDAIVAALQVVVRAQA